MRELDPLVQASAQFRAEAQDVARGQLVEPQPGYGSTIA
jgi:hypothetical protein